MIIIIAIIVIKLYVINTDNTFKRKINIYNTYLKSYDKIYGSLIIIKNSYTETSNATYDERSVLQFCDAVTHRNVFTHNYDKLTWHCNSCIALKGS